MRFSSWDFEIMMRRRSIFVSSFLSLAPPVASFAESVWRPSRPIGLVVPFAAGGPNDRIARLVAPYLQSEFGQHVIVENRPGASTAIGARYVLAQPADGCTVMITGSSTMTTTPLVVVNPGYDPERDFSPVTLAASVANVLVAHKDTPSRSMLEFVDWLARQGGRASFSSGGTGSPEHLGMELFLSAAKANAMHVPFSGGAPAVTAVIQGVVQTALLNAATVKPHVDSGALQAIAVAGPRRLRLLPTVPTMSEVGFPEVVSGSWSGVFVSSRVPQHIVYELNRTIVAALRRPSVADPLIANGFTIEASHPDVLKNVISEELLRWRSVVHRIGPIVN